MVAKFKCVICGKENVTEEHLQKVHGTSLQALQNRENGALKHVVKDEAYSRPTRA